MKKLGQCKSFWRHKSEWSILPEPKIGIELTRPSIYLTFQFTWLCFSAYYSIVWNKY
jgi:hypothetical protein